MVDSQKASVDTTLRMKDKRREQDRDGHWPECTRWWKQLGPPLRPSPEDLGFCIDTANQWIERNGAPRVLLLGVTPELYHLPWPNGTDFLAVDRTPSMILGLFDLIYAFKERFANAIAPVANDMMNFFRINRYVSMKLAS